MTAVSAADRLGSIFVAAYDVMGAGEIGKALDSSEVHVDRAQARRDRGTAITGIGATTVAVTGGLHALKGTHDEHVARMAAAGSAPHQEKMRLRQAKIDTRAVRTAKPMLQRVLRVKPKTAALAAGVGWAGLHGVELTADGLAYHANAKQLKNANSTLAKALRLKALNTLDDARPRSLRAKRPKATPLPANPAAANNLYKSASLDVTWSGEISKVDTDKRQVFGWASVSQIDGNDVVDLQGDIVPIEEIEKAAYTYVIESRKGGDMHRRVAKSADGTQPLHTADMIESFVVTPEKLEKMGLPPDALPHGWWVGYHVNDDEQWALVKSGARTGFSIHGRGSREPVADGSVAKKHVTNWSGIPRGVKLRPIARDSTRKRVLRTVNGTAARHGDRIIAVTNFASEPPFITPGVVLGKADGPGLKERTRQAIHPPTVKLTPVKSTFIGSVGYQPQTRRLVYDMKSRPGEPYKYRVKRAAANAAINAQSVGSHFAREVRGKAKRVTRYTPADRARLFLHPQPVDKAAPQMANVVSQTAKKVIGAATAPPTPPRPKILTAIPSSTPAQPVASPRTPRLLGGKVGPA